MNVPLSRTRPQLPLATVIGAGGLSAAIARRLGQNHRLLLADLDPERLEAAAALLRDEGNEVDTIQCDVTDPGSVTKTASRAAELGPLRTLAHVAGLSPSMADWRRILEVNLIGPALMSRAFLPLARAGTAAIFIASLAAHMARADEHTIAVLDDPLQPDFPGRLETALKETPTTNISYMLSKLGLLRLCQREAVQWGSRQARIMSLSPGMIATPMGAMEFKNQPIKHELLDRTPLARQGSMLEIADAVEFLASDRASFITGTDLLVDGGISAALRHAP